MGKLFIKIHTAVYIYMRLWCLTDQALGIFVAQKGQFYVPIHTLVHTEGQPHGNSRDITAITFSCPT